MALSNKSMRFTRASLCLLVLFFSFLHNSTQVTAFQSISQNKKYVNGGLASVITTSSNTSWNSIETTVPYAFSFSSSIKGVFLSLNDLGVNAPSIILSFYGTANNVTQTSFLLNVYSNTSSKITALSYRYMAIALQDSNTFGWILKTVVQAVNLNFDSNYYNYYFNYRGNNCRTANVNLPLDKQFTFDFPALNSYTVALLGYDVNSSSSGFSLGVKLSDGWYVNVSSLTAQIQVCVSSSYYSKSLTQTLVVPTIHFSLLIANRSYDPTLPAIRSQYSTYSPSQFTFLGSFYGPAAIVAINYTIFSGYSTFQSFSIIASDYSINLISSIEDFTFGVTITSFYTFYCPYNTPYLLNNYCYDNCPTGTNANQVQLTCSKASTSTTNNTAFQIGAILGYLSFFLILILIIVVFCLLKKRNKQKPELQKQPSNIALNANKYQQQMSNQLIRDQSEQSPAQKGGWRKRSVSQMKRQQNCSLCNQAKVTFKTECNHEFHIECIAKWSNNKKKCPNCKEENGVFSEKVHRVICRICRKKEKCIKFSDFKKNYEAGGLSQEFVCSCSKKLP